MSSPPLDKTRQLLYDIVSYLRVSAAAASRAPANVIDTEEKAKVYSMLNGTATQTEIAAQLGIPRETVRDWLGAFVRNGLAAAPSEYYAAHKALFALEELGIELAVLRKRKARIGSLSPSGTQDTLQGGSQAG